MTRRLPIVAGVIVIAVGAAAGAVWWSRDDTPSSWPDGGRPGAIAGEEGAAAVGGQTGVANSAPTDPKSGVLPVPPFPPRIADGDRYDQCMTMIANDPEGAEAIATSWQAAGGGDAAIHCQALAAIATGEPESGAALLENLARGGKVEGLTRAVLLGQAAEARLMADQAAAALKDTTEALAISPDDPDLLIGRANANDALDRSNDALVDLNQALSRDPSRGDALVLRASLWRRMNKLDEARTDIDGALALDPEDADALVERGILRQAKGDLAGAREDWTHAKDVDPNSEAAELAAQNLTLLDAGPAAK